MNYIIKNKDLGAFVDCTSQMMYEIGYCGFAYEDDFKNIVNSGNIEFFVSYDDDISAAFRNLKKQINNIGTAKNVYFFISTKADFSLKDFMNYYCIIKDAINAEKFFANFYIEELYEKNKMYLYVNK